MSKPVAYINVEERKLEWAEPITWHTPTIAKMDKIPLYTHPVKELTDEEIMQLYEEFIETQYASESNVLGFGRAILRKAQEK